MPHSPTGDGPAGTSAAAPLRPLVPSDAPPAKDSVPMAKLRPATPARHGIHVQVRTSFPDLPGGGCQDPPRKDTCAGPHHKVRANVTVVLPLE